VNNAKAEDNYYYDCECYDDDDDYYYYYSYYYDVDGDGAGNGGGEGDDHNIMSFGPPGPFGHSAWNILPLSCNPCR